VLGEVSPGLHEGRALCCRVRVFDVAEREKKLMRGLLVCLLVAPLVGTMVGEQGAAGWPLNADSRPRVVVADVPLVGGSPHSACQIASERKRT
jgi:hypothetical protein